MKKLLAIQQALHAPKNKENKFGGFSYRNAETMLASLKPHLDAHSCVVVLSDRMEPCNDRCFLVATASLIDADTGEEIAKSMAVAQHPEKKTKSDDAQISGACSSYARKYALCGLFAIDDSTHDPDGTNKYGKGDSGSSLNNKKQAFLKSMIDQGIDKQKAMDEIAAAGLAACGKQIVATEEEWAKVVAHIENSK